MLKQSIIKSTIPNGLTLFMHPKCSKTVWNLCFLQYFAENVENVNSSLSQLEGALQKQTELLDVNRQLIKSMEGLQTIVTDSNDQMVVELRALTQEMSTSTQQVSELVKGSSQSQIKSINLEIKKQLSGASNKTIEEISQLKSKIKITS